MDLAAIKGGIYALFLADADLLAALGGNTESVTSARRMYDEKAPQDVEFPYVTFQYISGLPDPTWTSDGDIAQFQFSIFHQDKDQPLNRTTIDEVFRLLGVAYDDSTLTITGHTSIAVTAGVSGVVETEDDMQQIVANYEIMVEDN